MEGDDITLECIGTDYITWYHDGEKMEASDVYGQSLQLKNITEEQAVIYTCKLGDTEEKNITVNVKSYPKFTEKPERLTKTVGEDAVFKCMLNTENYTVQWFGNWKPLPASERYVLDNANTTLTIHNVSKADTQTISCTATVGNFSISAEGSLTVYDPLRITSPPSDKVLGDDAVEFCVEVETDAATLNKTTFTWKKDNATLANIKPAIETMILSVTKMKNCLKLEGSDRIIGQYTCLVSDRRRSKSASANLFAPETMTGLTSGAIIGIVVGSIFAITLVAAIVGYVCYKQSRSNRKYKASG
ncbi:carcinoembryonic antigen-related cell adhesion molecule 5-like isoform X2 [Liolophura sinensis]|uniref:carcinoembryonic antigen-related cell adhesion molecule 5-like isoform X2 n=1 Tax=Liolophura sinensis TaxID=3198878 RepID=UPI0031591A07